LKAPYTFLTLIQSVCPTCVNEHAYEFTFWLLWFNSTLNPILYPFLHVKFRKAFLKIIHNLLFCFKFERQNKYRPANSA
jgi:histamine receptor H3